jgi:hypothetical protein
MKLRFLAPALALVLTTIAAHAQIGIYVNPVVSHISNSTADTGPYAFLGDGQKAQTFGGVDFGGYYDFAHLSKADVSADVRDTIQHGNNASFNSFMVGLRLAAKPMAFAGLKPYAQLSVGEGRTRAPLSNAQYPAVAVRDLWRRRQISGEARGLAHCRGQLRFRYDHQQSDVWWWYNPHPGSARAWFQHWLRLPLQVNLDAQREVPRAFVCRHQANLSPSGVIQSVARAHLFPLRPASVRSYAA